MCEDIGSSCPLHADLLPRLSQEVDRSAQQCIGGCRASKHELVWVGVAAEQLTHTRLVMNYMQGLTD